MQPFRDHKNRDWEIRMNIEVMLRWREKCAACGIPDPMDLAASQNAIWGDPLKASAILKIVLGHPLAEARIDPGIFLMEMDPETLWRAQQAMMEEYCSFFAQPAQRAIARANADLAKEKAAEILGLLKSGALSGGPQESQA